MRELVHALKFQDRHDVRRLLGRWLVEAGRDLISEAEVIVPVPLSRWRLLQRQFQPGCHSGQGGCPPDGPRLRADVLRRTRATPSQVRPDAASAAGERHRRVYRDSARTEQKSPAGISPIADDVITTEGDGRGLCRGPEACRARNVDVPALALVTDTALMPL